MPASPFEASVRYRDTIAVIDLGGDISGPAGPVLDAAYEDALAGGATGVLLNFSGVGYINSTGIALIVGILSKARAGRVPVVASGLDDHYREIFTITRLSDFMPLYPDEDSAIRDHPTATV